MTGDLKSSYKVWRAKAIWSRWNSGPIKGFIIHQNLNLHSLSIQRIRNLTMYNFINNSNLKCYYSTLIKREKKIINI